MTKLQYSNIINTLLHSSNPTIQYKTKKLIVDESETSSKMIALRESIKESDVAKSLLSHIDKDGTIHTHPYKKHQGPHWTLFCLAQIEYPPPNDSKLIPLRDQVYNWLFEKEHLKFPQSLLIHGQEDRFRRCATQEGNAIWYSIKLGIDNEQTYELVNRLIKWQWPDGGWNCDKRPSATTSSVIESLVPLRALYLASKHYNDKKAFDYANKTAEYFLKRMLYKRLHDGNLILPLFTKIQYPIQFYDVLFSLFVMSEIEKINDPRCNDAINLLISKQLSNGGFPLELKNAITSNELVPRGTYADWGISGKTKMNEYITVDSLYVLKKANRW